MFNHLQKFLENEDTNLFDLHIGNVAIWKYFRSKMYDKYITSEYEVEKRVSSSLYKTRDLGKIYQQVRYILKNRIPIEKAEILFCNFPRKAKVNGRYICPQLNDFIKNTPYSKFVIEYPFWIEDKSYATAHFISDFQDQDKVYFTDFFELKACFKAKVSYLFFIPFLIINHKKMSKFISILNENMKLNVKRMKLYRQILFFYVYEKDMKKSVRRMLKKINPRCLIEVYTSNRHLAVINEICHELGIIVIDIQHGAWGEYEPIMYTFYKKNNYKHLSDYIFCLGEYWKKKGNLHLSQNQVLVTGSPFLEKCRCKVNKRTKILILSQTRYHSFFYNLAKKLSKVHQFKVAIKLHPYEYGYFINGEYKYLQDLGVEIIWGMEKHLYSCFDNAKCVIGVNSTALYEALAFDIPVFFMKGKYGTENLEQLVGKFNIFEFTNFDELISMIKKIKNLPYRDNTSQFFCTNSIERYNDNLQLVFKNLL